MTSNFRKKRELDNERARRSTALLEVRARSAITPALGDQRTLELSRLTFILVVVGLLCFLGGASFMYGVDPRSNLVQARYDALLIQYETLDQDQKNLSERHKQLQDRYDGLKQEHAGLISKCDLLVGQKENLVRGYNDLMRIYESLLGQSRDLEQGLQKLARDYDALFGQNENLKKEYGGLIVTYNTLLGEKEGLLDDYSELIDEYGALWSRSIRPPYIYIHNRTVDIAFERTGGEIEKWEISFDTLEQNIRRGYSSRKKEKSVSLRKTDTEEMFRMVDYRPFVDAGPFEKVIATLYWELNDDDAFIREVWHIVTQLTSYSEDVGETPRYPLETFLAGGGDCEDTAILLASMIAAAPVDWKVELVYMDMYNPSDPVEPNHVIVCVDTGEQKYWIETTSSEVMCPYEPVNGWYFEVG